MKSLTNYDCDIVRDEIVLMTNAKHVDIGNSNAQYTLDDDAEHGWQWLTDDQLRDLYAILAVEVDYTVE